MPVTRARTPQDLHLRRPGRGAAANVAFINLGCARNTVDSQAMIGTLLRQGHALSSVDGADTVIVNTCAFVEDAKKESIDTILELAALKKAGKIRRIIVAGCLAQRYGSGLVRELGEVDAFLGVQPLSHDRPQALPYLTPPHYAYVKICESCFNACSFCVIPKIKGKFVSRPMDAVIDDVRRLDANGVREINIIGQDVTAYGLDIYHRKALPELLKKISAATKAPWIRVLYMHPAHISDALLDVIAGEARICKYLDIPLQHVSDPVLKNMNRNMTWASTVALVKKVRHKVPGACLRTTFIVGFPGETKDDFDRLLRFVKDHPFERAGVFMYSREEGTPAYHMPGQVPRAIAQRRYDELMKLQQQVALKLHEKLVGRVMPVLVEAKDKESKGYYTGRSAFDAPDVDGTVRIRASRTLSVGEFAQVRITGAAAYDLQGDAV